MRRAHRLTSSLILLCAASAPFLAGAASDGPQRLALVVGNAMLGNERVLAAVPRDVQAVSAALRSAGYLVMVREDIGADALRGTLDEFRARLRPDGIGLIYLATLGTQVEGQTLLLMRDTPAPDAASPAALAAALQRDAIELVEVLQALAGGKGPRALVLDAAWQHPVLDRLPQRGLAAPALPAGVVALWGLPPGQVQTVPAAPAASAVGAASAPAASPGGPVAARDIAATPLARQLATRFVIAGVTVADTLRAVRQDLADASPALPVPWLGGDTDASLPLAEPPATDRPKLDGRTQAAGERGERPVFAGRRNAFGHAEGDVFAFRRVDGATLQELGVETLFIETLAADGTLLANGGDTAMDAQGRPLRQRASDGSITRYSPSQELWWAAPVPGQRRKVAFTESIERTDGTGAAAEWAGTAEVGAPRMLSLPAGEIEALPLLSRGTVSVVPAGVQPGASSGAPRVVRRRWQRTVWVAPVLGHPVAVDIEDSDAEGRPLPPERLELLRVQTSRDAR